MRCDLKKYIKQVNGIIEKQISKRGDCSACGGVDKKAMLSCRQGSDQTVGKDPIGSSRGDEP